MIGATKTYITILVQFDTGLKLANMLFDNNTKQWILLIYAYTREYVVDADEIIFFSLKI